eukprot:CAMPEP_0118638276 /NCGR_PEP_ID=MMETSP0785-20121206/3590_1 /TAXON_ID=91992 /ORGANISM="Bolidomonas pacifica, Strain CCMP 1866" /LENGTH=166 /DNA_ID=CAMNT_0006529499 /DNA_START=99 /DNA_END=596 /DNA_ORIENTATION=-
MSDFASAPGDMTIAELITAQEGGGFQIEPLIESPNIPSAIDPSPLPPNFGETCLTAPCSTCGDIGENWLCLHSRKILCSRYRNGCAVKHFEANPNQCVHLSLSDLSVWDHALEAYLDVFNISALQPAFAAIHLAKFGTAASFPTPSVTIDMSGGDDDGKKPAAATK